MSFIMNGNRQEGKQLVVENKDLIVPFLGVA
jgi:hypothetical protein